MYCYDWLSRRIVDLPVEDMAREWREIKAPSVKPVDIEKLEAAEKRYRLKSVFIEAQQWARLYGGAAIVMGIEDGRSPNEPIDIEHLKQDSLKFLLALDKNYIVPQQINTSDWKRPNYFRPETYSINGEYVHESRVLSFDGIRLPWRKRQQTNYWGGSFLRSVYEAILDSQATSHIIASLIYESKLDVISVPELHHELTSPDGVNKILTRFKLADIIKSVNNTLLLDSREQFDRKATNFAGLSDLQKNYLLIVSAASGIPATRLLGQSAQGLNATGEGDQKDYYDTISAKQESEFEPNLNKFDEIFVRSVLGYWPADWGFEFPSLFQLTDLERADLDLKNSQRDMNYVNIQAIDPLLVTKDLLNREVYSDLDVEYVDLIAGTDRE